MLAMDFIYIYLINIYILLYRDCEKNIQDEVIGIEEPPISTDPKNREGTQSFQFTFLPFILFFLITLTRKIHRR